MPADSRRVSGPDNTLQYYLYSKQKKTYEECEKELINSDNLRKDGRKLDSSRRICKYSSHLVTFSCGGDVHQNPYPVASKEGELSNHRTHEIVTESHVFEATNKSDFKPDMKTGVISQAKGSAYVELRNTKVICSVFDPREIPNKSEFSVKGELYCEFKFANFACKKRRNFVRDPEEKELSVSLRRSLEPAVCLHEFPNFQVDVYCMVLQDDGGSLSAAINCAGLALADASVPMFGLVTSASLAVHGERSLLDPTSEEENVCGAVRPKDRGDRGLVTLAYLANLKQVTELCQSGTMSAERVIDAVDVLEKQALQVHPAIQHCLAESVRKHHGRALPVDLPVPGKSSSSQ